MILFTWRWTKCLEKSGKRHKFVLEKSEKPQADFCTNTEKDYDIDPIYITNL